MYSTSSLDNNKKKLEWICMSIKYHVNVLRFDDKTVLNILHPLYKLYIFMLSQCECRVYANNCNVIALSS